MKSGIELIKKERERQISAEGWTQEHDDQHYFNELANAAAAYALCKYTREIPIDHIKLLDEIWPWSPDWWKPTPDDRIRELVKAGALIAAEIDRLNRKIIRNRSYLDKQP